MSDQTQFDVRDIRNRNWLWARRELIRGHGQELGVYGVAVYVALASFADTETQSEAKPSVSQIARMLDCSANKVRDAIRDLDRLGWIDYRERERPDGSQTSHLFRLLKCPVTDPYHGGAPPSRDEGGPPHEMKPPPSRDEGHKEKGNRREREEEERGFLTNQPNNPESRKGAERPDGLAEEKIPLFDTLTERGVSANQAATLVQKYSAERVSRQLRHFEIKLNDGEDVGPGLLVELIREDRSLPRQTGRDTWEPDPRPDNSEVDPSKYRHLIPGTEEYLESHRNNPDQPDQNDGNG